MSTKSKLIEILLNNEGEFISGENLGRSLGVSRSAVSKAVMQLREEGFNIESVQKSGHRIITGSDVFCAEAISATLGRNVEVLCFDSIDSTSTYAKKLVASGEKRDIIVAAAEQTAGRGRSGKSFYSPVGTGVYFSCVMHPGISLSDATSVTAFAAVAVCEVLETLCVVRPVIKWVNDIFVNGKKVCGILTEAVTDFESGNIDAVIIGIGINLNTKEFPQEIKDIAGSVGCRVNRSLIIAEIADRLYKKCPHFASKDFMQEYKNRSAVIGKKISFTKNGTDYIGIATDITNNGELVVDVANGPMLLSSGEISINPKELF